MLCKKWNIDNQLEYNFAFCDCRKKELWNHHDKREICKHCWGIIMLSLWYYFITIMLLLLCSIQPESYSKAQFFMAPKQRCQCRRRDVFGLKKHLGVPMKMQSNMWVLIMHLQLNLIDVKPCLCCQIFNALCKLNPERVQNPEENPREMERALERISFFSMGEIPFFHPFISLQMFYYFYHLQTCTGLVVLSSYNHVWIHLMKAFAGDAVSSLLLLLRTIHTVSCRLLKKVFSLFC